MSSDATQVAPRSPGHGARAAARRIAAGPAATVVLVGACLAAAGASLALPFFPNADAWSWLVWGRELAYLQLDTTVGSAWKPLPVLITAFLWPFGDAAPSLWLVLVRASWLVAVVLAYRVGARLGGWVAGAIAAFGLLLLPSVRAEWLDYVLVGRSEPLIAAVALGAVERHMAGRRMQALGLGVLVALGRPEAWPLLIAYGIVVWRAEPDRRPLVAAAIALVPALWVAGDLLGGGEALSTAERVREQRGGRQPDPYQPSPAEQLTRYPAVRYSLSLTIAPLLLGALASVANAIARYRVDRGARTVLGMAVAVVAWISISAAGSRFGFPQGPRFLFVPAVVLSVLGGVGLAAAVQAVRPRWGRIAAAAATVALLAVTALPRAQALPAHLRATKVNNHRTLTALLSRPVVIREAVRCHGLATVINAPPEAAREAAWRFRLHLRAVRTIPRGSAFRIDRGIVVAREHRASLEDRGNLSFESAGRSAKQHGWRKIAESGRWSAFAAGCPRAA